MFKVTTKIFNNGVIENFLSEVECDQLPLPVKLQKPEYEYREMVFDNTKEAYHYIRKFGGKP